MDNNLSTEEEPKPGGKRIVNRVTQVYASVTSTPLEITIEANKTDYELAITGGR